MKIYKTTRGIIIEHNSLFYLSAENDWDKFVNNENLYNSIQYQIETLIKIDGSWIQEMYILAPIQSQEIWAAGVTYLRSMHARVEESQENGGSSFYDKVYDAERPEIFFKATAQRTVGHNGLVRIRKDSAWNVPEPELTLFITSEGSIVGYTIGNDMSSRSIEGENPLYLPQAKMYEGCCALGPCLYVPDKPITPQTIINIIIERDNSIVYDDSISISQMKRQHVELVKFLYRECNFPHGCFLMTGTGIVPPKTFSLKAGDIINISIENIGTLTNKVA